MTTEINADLTAAAAAAEHASSLGTAAARNLATTTKSVPQMQGISSRWLLKVLPWVEVAGGTYRVNRRLSYTIGDGRIQCIKTGARVQVIPQELGELPLLKGYADGEVLAALADRFVQTEYAPGDLIVTPEQEVDRFHILAHGKVDRLGAGKYGHPVSLGVLSDGAYFGEQALIDEHGVWEFGFRAVTPCVLLSLTKEAFAEVAARATGLRAHLDARLHAETPHTDADGEAAIELSSGHQGEPTLPHTYVAYETHPREYELSVAQTVLRVHSRVADLYNEPMNQVEQQLRLTVEALRERQEHEIVNNRDFGLLHNADHGHRISTRSGPPTPDDLDDLLAVVWKEPTVFLAHPHAIAAFGRECSKLGLYPSTVNLLGREMPAWRGVPILTCNKMPISDTGVSSMILMRTGEDSQGVVGLHQTGLPDEYEPGLNVRFMGVNEQAIISYLVSAYYSAAVLVPDALGVLENVELGHRD
ncbi:family 2B encapsulin nanocompartment shell protein [Herbidospora mongoliensis]|uniref:family 2B encapsulin nanocompartment shell protein n=1 Tax=Herbidospora mongoliensis TaxID=688067 RepID=UPI000836A595|nr:family 2B encapsulin nanocompartment shell protein [Herbidospora mongoliensis]